MKHFIYLGAAVNDDRYGCGVIIFGYEKRDGEEGPELLTEEGWEECYNIIRVESTGQIELKDTFVLHVPT